MLTQKTVFCCKWHFLHQIKNKMLRFYIRLSIFHIIAVCDNYFILSMDLLLKSNGQCDKIGAGVTAEFRVATRACVPKQHKLTAPSVFVTSPHPRQTLYQRLLSAPADNWLKLQAANQPGRKVHLRRSSRYATQWKCVHQPSKQQVSTTSCTTATLSYAKSKYHYQPAKQRKYRKLVTLIQEICSRMLRGTRN